MRILDSRVVAQKPTHQIHLELTSDEMNNLARDLQAYKMPGTVSSLLNKIVFHQSEHKNV